MFDFDGVLVDTESAELEAWRAAFREFGVELPMDAWMRSIGLEHGSVDFLDVLESMVGRVDREALVRDRIGSKVIHSLPTEPMPGALELIADLESRGLRLAICSSSPHWWVDGLVERLDLPRLPVIGREDAPRAKPHPDLYLEACRRLDVLPGQALAVEDSANGARAAKAAGMACVVVPNSVTLGSDFSHADAVLPALGAVPGWLAKASQK